MLEHGEDISAVIWCDMGDWEFPEIAEHIALVEQNTGLKITRVRPTHGMNYWMYDRKVIARTGEMKGEVWRLGNGWPSPLRRWCTRQKIQAINMALKNLDGTMCIGIAADETKRRLLPDRRYPLIEYGYTEAMCLKYCNSLGYHWGGLYDIFTRVSCWCCPLSSISDLRKLRKYRPELWNRLMEMDMRQHRHNPGFKDNRSVIDFEMRFRNEDGVKIEVRA